MVIQVSRHITSVLFVALCGGCEGVADIFVEFLDGVVDLIHDISKTLYSFWDWEVYSPELGAGVRAVRVGCLRSFSLAFLGVGGWLSRRLLILGFLVLAVGYLMYTLSKAGKTRGMLEFLK